jgi:protein transport protein SEC24
MALRDTNNVPSDMRSYIMSCYYVSGIAMNIVEIYPRFWDLHTIPDGGGGGLITRTPLVNLGSDRIERGGMYLLDNGHDMFIWIGKGADPRAVVDLFDMSYDDLNSGKVRMGYLILDFTCG